MYFLFLQCVPMCTQHIHTCIFHYISHFIVVTCILTYMTILSVPSLSLSTIAARVCLVCQTLHHCCCKQMCMFSLCSIITAHCSHESEHCRRTFQQRHKRVQTCVGELLWRCMNKWRHKSHDNVAVVACCDCLSGCGDQLTGGSR